MKVKRYETTNLMETTEQIRRELGRDAVIIATRRLGGGGLLRRSARFEILAGVPDGEPAEYPAPRIAPSPTALSDDGVLESPAVRLALSDPVLAQRVARAAAERAASAMALDGEPALARASAHVREGRARERADTPVAAPEPATAMAVLGSRLGEIEREVRQLREKRRGGIDAHLPRPAADLLDRLAERGFDDRLVAGITADTLAAKGDAAAVRRALAQRLPAASTFRVAKGRRQLIVLTGPAASGKTTAAVKLASALHAEGKRVLLATLDTTRVAGEARLVTYARALDIPARVCYGPGELLEAMQSSSSIDAAIVDTAGFNSYAPEDAVELRRVLAQLPDARVLLTVRADMPACDVEAAHEMAGRGAAGIVITAADATGAPGGALSAISELGAPVLFIGDSDDVLRPMLPADRDTLVRLALGESLRVIEPEHDLREQVGA